MSRAVPVAEIRAAGGLETWISLQNAPQATKLQKTTQDKGKAAKPQQRADSARKTACTGPPSRPGKGRVPEDLLLGFQAEGMNGLEARYAVHLETLRRAGRVVCRRYEAMVLRLADRTVYIPDFFLLLPDGSVGFHETKGFWREDARVKTKVAAAQFPWFFFTAVQWDAGTGLWKYERFGRHGGDTWTAQQAKTTRARRTRTPTGA